MKKIAVVLTLVLFVVIGCACGSSSTNTDYLRIHIRADSNDVEDQQVKYIVKAAVVDYLTPYVAQATTKQAALSVVKQHIDGICQVANKVLGEQGFDYLCKAKVTVETFPSRTYNGLTLQSGVYDALVLELGSGNGDNWWCVVYPPLCFVGGQSNGTNSVVYRSLLKEIIDGFLAEHSK